MCMYNVQCIIACHITCVLSLPLPLPFFGFARSRQVKSPTKVQNVTPEVPAQSSPQPIAEASSTASSTPEPTDMCRVQVRHPNDQVIRRNFPSSASLNDVVTLVMENEPIFSTVILVQVFTNKCLDLSSLSLSLSVCLSFSHSSHSHTMSSHQKRVRCHCMLLDFAPQHSLVVSKQSVGGASATMETGPSHSIGSTTYPAPRGSKKVSFGREQMMTASSHTNRTLQGVATCMYV